MISENYPPRSESQIKQPAITVFPYSCMFASVHACVLSPVHACLLHPKDPSHMSFPAAPYRPSITQYSQTGVNMWVNALNLCAERVPNGRKKNPSLLLSAQPFIYRAQVVLLLRGLISWFFALSPFGDSGSLSGQN